MAPSRNLNHLVAPSFQGITRFFVLAFENDAQITNTKDHYIPNVAIKKYNVMINGEKVFDQSIKNDKATYENIRKICTNSGDDYTRGCLLEYPYFKYVYKMIVVDLIK